VNEAETYHLTTLGCPKNDVDSDKLEGTLQADGLARVDEIGDADVVVVNTCAFIEDARTESIDTIIAVAAERRPGAQLVVTGCMAERHGPELAAELDEIDLVAPSPRRPLRWRWSSAPHGEHRISTCSTCLDRRRLVRGPT
jgi:ribosomal protein S12 methylthiotransferase